VKRLLFSFGGTLPNFPLPTLANVFVGISSLFALTCPILFTPIVADDFFNPLYQLSKTGGSYWSSLEYGVASAWNGASLRIVGNAVGAVTNNVLTDFSGRLGVPFGFTFGLIKFIGFLALATALTYYLKTVFKFES
jgi:ABC-type cobalamin transport system permease subunit